MPEGKGLALPYTFFAGGDSPDFAAQQNFQHIVTFVNRRLARISEMKSRYLSSAQTLTTATLTDVTDIKLNVLEDSVYRIEIDLYGVYSSDGLDFQLNVPSGATFDGNAMGLSRGNASEDQVLYFAAVVENTEYADIFAAFTAAGTVPYILKIVGVLVMAGTEGTIQLQMSKNTDSTTDPTIEVGSSITSTSTQLDTD